MIDARVGYGERQQGRGMSDDSLPHAHLNKRTTIELGTVVAIALVMGGLIFNAGVSYDRQQQIEQRQDKQDVRISKLQDSNIRVGTSLVELKTLMHTVIQNQKRMQDQRDSEGRQ